VDNADDKPCRTPIVLRDRIVDRIEGRDVENRRECLTLDDAELLADR
jgi:hypothetical protein